MMASNWTDTEARSRGARMLRTAIGPMVGHWLTDPLVVEVMLNPDGCLWVDRLGTGLADTGRRLAPADAERFIRLVAHPVGVQVTARLPPAPADRPANTT